MATAPNYVSLEEYMQTSYSPDCEYIDGEIRERNVGQGKHAFTQLGLGAELRQRLTGRGLIVTVEHRVRVSPGRVRIPDVCVVEELEEVITKPPLLCVEVLSPDDRWSQVNSSISDYRLMEVSTVWVIDPYQRRAWIFENEAPPVEVQDGRLRAQALAVEISLAEVLPK